MTAVANPCADCGTALGDVRRDESGDYLCASCYGKRCPPQSPMGDSPAPKAARSSEVLTAPLAAQELAGILGLAAVDVRVTGARIVGKGSTASADIYLSNGETMTFESLRDVSNPRFLTVEAAACAGVAAVIKGPQAVKVVVLLRTLAAHIESTTADDLAVEWGLGYLQSAPSIEVSMEDQASRWEAFSELDTTAAPDVFSASAGAVLVDNDIRFVRADWFRRWVKREDPSTSLRDVTSRMLRVGWQRPGREGRIKATRPEFVGELTWSFLIVPGGWESSK